MTAVVIYSRPGCHLCDEMKAVVESLRRTRSTPPFTLQEIDISTDPQLEAQFGLEIPVMFVDGRKVAKYRIAAEAFRRMLKPDG